MSHRKYPLSSKRHPLYGFIWQLILFWRSEREVKERGFGWFEAIIIFFLKKVMKRFQNVSLTRTINNLCKFKYAKRAVVKRFQNVSLTRTINNIFWSSNVSSLVVKRFQNVSLTRTINNEFWNTVMFLSVVKRFQNVSLTRTINNEDLELRNY